MREQNLIDELNRFDTDERFALEKCGYSPDDKLEGRQKEIFEYERKSLREKIAANLSNIKNWNKSNSSGVPPRFSESSFFNFECRTETEKSIYQKVCNFVSQEGNEGVLLMTGTKGTGKTHLGAAAVRDTQGRYVSMEDLIYKVESSMNFKSP